MEGPVSRRLRVPLVVLSCKIKLSMMLMNKSTSVLREILARRGVPFV